MLNNVTLASRIVRIIRQVMPALSSPGDLVVDANLYDAGLTSMAMVKLMLAIEIEFDVSIPDPDLHPNNFRSIRAIEALVKRLR